ncbi:MAG: branched-chain amino acid ABC transporter permease, partial [Arthrobacter sp.]
ALLGGAIVAYIPVRFTAIADYKYLIFGVVLVLLMIFRSQGLVPAKMRLLAFARRAMHWVPTAEAKSTPDPANATEGTAS